MVQARFVASLLILGACSTGIVVACSSDDSATNPGTTPGTSTTTTVRITAATGGTVADPSGKTSLAIPPGALEKDTDITLAILPKTGSAVVDISEFGPDGLKFLKPATLTIKADATLAPEGKSLALAVNEGADFRALEDSSFANGTATASIMHFSRYTVVIVDGKIVVKPPESCNDARSTFAACGGDPKGTWTFAEFCAAQTDLGGSGNVCPENSVDIEYKLDREVTVDATTIKITAGTATLTANYNYFLACFNRIPDSGSTFDSGLNDCATLQQKQYTDKGKAGTCVDKAGGYCVCTETGQSSAPEETQTYTVSGTTITITKSDATVTTSDYCVNGDVLSVKEPDKDGKPGLLYVLKRK